MQIKQLFYMKRIGMSLAIATVSTALSWLPTPPKAEAQSCNPFGCSQPGAGECNPFGCPNPGAGSCTPFGCPASSAGGFNSRPSNSGGSTSNDINNGLGILRQLFGGGGRSRSDSESDRSAGSNRRSGNSDLNRILTSYGLVPTDCNPGVVEIKISSNLDRSVCAIPNAQYPAGLYVLNQQDYSITAIGGHQPPQQLPIQPAQIPGQSGTVVYYPQPTPPPFQSGYYPPQQPAQPLYGQPGQVNLPPAQSPYNQPNQPSFQAPGSPAILLVGNPSQPIPADITAQITASLAGRGLTPVSCSASPGVTITVGSYMACAYPTATYPAGRYTLR